MSQTRRTFERQAQRTYSLPYLLYTPPDYHDHDEWPLVMFLHGLGERGSDLERLKLHGLPRLIEAGRDYPFVVISPQCPITEYWPTQTEALNALLDEALDVLKINPARVYLTGLSMGGYGTWHLAAQYPQRFAAIAPICGGGSWWMRDRLKTIPTWVFHGADDDVVTLSESERMVEMLRQKGAHVRFTVYPGVKHNSWDPAYDEPELFPWMLNHSL